MNRQNHSEPKNRFTPEEQQEFIELLAQLSPEQREALKEVLKSFTYTKQCGVASCHPALFIFFIFPVLILSKFYFSMYLILSYVKCFSLKSHITASI